MEDSGAPALLGGQSSSLSTVLKQLRKEQNGMWSCLNSLLEDSSFVAELRWAILARYTTPL
mgnify:CR=1 FL=1